MSGNNDFNEMLDMMPRMFDTIGENLPKILKGIRDQLFSPDAGRDIGKAVGSFYKELVASGIDPNQALQLTKEYIKTLENFSSQMNIMGNQQDKK